MALSNSAMTSTKAKKNNIPLKANKVLEFVDGAGDVKIPNKYFNFSNGTSKGVCKEESKGSYVNLPTRVGSFEISINMPLASQLIPSCEQYFADSSSINSEKVNTNATVYAEKIPRSLSPDVFIKAFEKSSAVASKRKQRTPVKADVKSQGESPTSDIENPSINLNSSKTTCQKLDDNDQCGYYEQTKPILIQCNRPGKKGAKNNLDLKLSRPMSINSDLVSAVLNSPVDSKLNKSVTDIKSSKRKLQQTSKNFGSEPISKKQKKKMVKFHPNISEVIKPPVDEEMIDGSSKSSSQVSGKVVLDNSVLNLLHSRNVEVTFQNSKSVTSQKMPVSKKTLGSLSKAEKNMRIKTFSQDRNEKMDTELCPDVLERAESEKEIASFTSSFHNSSKKFGYSIENNTLLNSVHENVSNLSDSGTFKMKATARMRTSKYGVKSILKKKALSPKSKSNRVSSNMLRENLQQYGLDENINSDDEPSPSIIKGKPLSTTESSEVTGNLHSSISTARMKTAKPSKGILKNKMISPKSKCNKVSSNMQSENLQQHGLEENINSDDETSPSVNKGKSSSTLETSDILLSNVFTAWMKTAKIHSKGSLTKKAVSPKSKGNKVSSNIQSESLQQHGLAENVNNNDEITLSVNRGKSSSKIETSDITDNLLSNISDTKRKTAKIPGKSILKKKAVSPNSKRNKVSSNIQSESLKHHGLEKDVNSDNETSLSINKGKSSSGITEHLISNVSHNQSQILEEGSPTIALLYHNEGSPRKPIIRRGRPKSTKAKPSPLGRRKYSKKSPKRDLNVSTDTSENLEGSASDSDDNMPIISFLKSKPESLQEKSEHSTKVLDEENLFHGFNELLKNAKGKKKRGRGRKRQKIGSQKSKNMKEEIDADSSFVEEDDEEEQAIIPTAQSHAKRKHQKRTGRRYSVTGNWYIAAGYLNDIMSLLEDFENCDGWRFNDFAKCWQKKSFSLVYRGRQTFKELLEFSEEIALLTMRFIGPSHSTKRRIGALYTLYGLYYKFPVGHFFNIRFELDEYKNLLELIQPFRSNIENPDPAYIFCKLELKGAILHCATACEPCYDFHNDERDLVDLEYGKQKLAKSSAVNIALPSIQLETDSELLTYYHSIKAKLTGQGSEPEPERALSLISSEFLSTITSDLSEMRKRTISILGMTPKALINTSTHGGEDSNKDESDEKRIQCSGEGISRANELDCYLHSVEDNVLNTVNNGSRALKALEGNENIMIMQDKSVLDFMNISNLEDLDKPLTLAKKSKIASNDFDLNVKLTTVENGVSQVPNPVRVNLKATDLHEEIGEDLLPHPCPRKRKRGSRRSVILMHAAKPRSRMSKKTYYNPCPSKSLLDTKLTVEKPNTIFPGVSSTSLPFSDFAIISTHNKDKDTENINVTLTCGEEIKNIIVKVKRDYHKLEEIQQDPIRLQKFKAGLEPLVKLSLNGSDRDRLWLIQDIKPCYQTKTKSLEKSPVKLICFKQRFECLKEDNPVSSTDSDTSSDESVEEVMPNRIGKSKIDEDYMPISEDEEFQKETDKLLDEEFYKEDPYESDISSPDESDYPRRRGRRSGYSTIIERDPFDSDKLITPKGAVVRVRMAPIKIGGMTRYFPINENEKEESNKENSINELNTWNNFTSTIRPPLLKRRISRSGIDLGSKLPHLSPHNPRMSYILSTTPSPSYGNYQRPRKINSRPIFIPMQREKSFKEFFKKITRLSKYQVKDEDNFDMDNEYSDYDNSSAHEEMNQHIPSENENFNEVVEGLKERDFISHVALSDIVSTNSTLQETQFFHQSQESNMSSQQEGESFNLNSLEQVSNIYGTVPKIEESLPIMPTIKNEFSHTVEELVEDWDDDDDQDIISSSEPSTKESEGESLKLGKLVSQTKMQLKQEPLEEDSEKALPIPDSIADLSSQSDIGSDLRVLSNSFTYRVESSDSRTEIDVSPEVHKALQQTPESPNWLQASTVPVFSTESQPKDILDETADGEFNTESLNLPNEEQFISAENIKDLLYCKVKSSDGKDVFVPVTILDDIKSEIEVLSIQSSELKLSSPLKSPANLPILSERSCKDVPYVNSHASSGHIDPSPYVGSSEVNVQCSSLFPYNSIPVESYKQFTFPHSEFNSPSTSDWKCQKPIDLGQQSRWKTSPLHKLPITETFQIKSTHPSLHSTESSFSTANNSPMSTTSSASLVSKVFESPSVGAVSKSNCSFLFSPKLKRLTNKNVASGRPPCLEQKAKPIVKFMCKGSSWIKSSKRY